MSKTKDTLYSAYRRGGPSFGERRTATVLTDINTNRRTPMHWSIRWLWIVSDRRREMILEEKIETEKHTELGRKSRWHTRALNTNDAHNERRPRTNWRPDGRADTVCVAFFCVRLRGTAGGGRPPVWCGRRVRAQFGTPTGRGRIRNYEKENTPHRRRRRRETARDGGWSRGRGRGKQLLLVLVYGSPLATFSVERTQRTANALYQRTVITMTEPTRGDEDAKPFTIFTRREGSGGTGGGNGDDGFSLFVSLGFFGPKGRWLEF